MIFGPGLVGFLFFVVLLMSSAGWGYTCLTFLSRLLTRSNPQDNFKSISATLYLSVVLGFGILSWLTLFIGLIGLLYPSVAGLLILTGIIAGLISFVPLFREQTKARNLVNEFRQAAFSRPLLIPLGLIGMSGIVFTLMAHTLMPPHEWDEVAYHLALPKLYIQQHQIIYVPFIVHSNWPMNTEMLFSLGLLFGSNLFSHFVTWGMTILTAWGVFLFGREFFSRRMGIVAAVLFLLVPLINRLAGTGLVDVALPFYGTAALYCYAHYWRTPSVFRASLIGLFGGMAASSKLTGLAYPILLGVLMLIAFWREKDLKWREFINQLLVMGALTLLMVGPWYLRSYIFTRNPIWPFLFNTLGGRNWDILGDEYLSQQLVNLWSVGLPLNAQGLVTSFYYVFFRPHALGGFRGLGQLTLILAVLCIVLIAIYRRVTPALLRDLAIFAGAYYLIWFFLGSHQARFLLIIIPPLVLLAAYAIDFIWIRISSPYLKGILVLLLAAAFIRESPWFSMDNLRLIRSRFPVIIGEMSVESFLESQLKTFQAIQYINEELAPDTKLLLLPFENRGFYLDRSYFWGHLSSQRIIRYETFDEPQRLAVQLRSMGITHILDNPEWIDTSLRYWEHDRRLMRGLVDQCGTLIKQWDDISLYELSQCQPSTGDI